MDAAGTGPSSVGSEKSFRLRVLLGAAALLTLLASAGYADGPLGNIAFGGFLVIFAIPILLFLTLGVSLLEGYVMDRVLHLGYRRCFWYAVAANVVSTVLGTVWYFAGGETGWKTALAQGEFDRVRVLFARSFVITLAEETVVVALLARKQRGAGDVFLAMVAANVASYVLLLLLIAVLTGWYPHF